MLILLSISFAQAQKTDVWDLGGQQLDTNLYNNKLTVSDVNAWYPGITAGTNSTNLPSSTVLTLTSGVLTLKTGGSDRLYTTNTAITRYGTGSLGTTDTNYTARYYCNGNASTTTRFFTLTLNMDDEVTIVSSAESAGNTLAVVNTTTNTQTEAIPLVLSGSTVTFAKFQAKQAGDFKISCLTGKGNYYRILRKPATYTTISGTVDETAAAGISGYSVSFTNPAGKVWTSPVTGGSFNITVPAGFTYQMSLVNANGYIISNGTSLAVTAATTAYNMSVLKVNLFTVSGSLTGLGTDISKLTALTYTPDPSANKVFVPVPVITGSNYTVDLEANTQYTVSATGVNDYEILSNTITISSATSSNIAFTLKPTYGVTITTTGLDATQLSNLKLTFTNLNESGYIYNFNSVSGITLRNGTYSVAYSGLDNYAVDCGTISNLKVIGAATSKTIDFKPVTIWSFDDRTVSTTTSAGYKGMLVTGTVSNRLAQGDLTAKTGATIKIPVKNIGDKVLISYYFAANFSIEGGTAITTTSGSTSIIENVEYTYTGTETTPGYVTITLGGTALTSYFTNIQVGGGSTTY